MQEILLVKVIPNAKKNEIIKRDNDFIVKINAPAVDGKANKELINFLSDYFNLKKSHIKILKGEKSRIKLISINK